MEENLTAEEHEAKDIIELLSQTEITDNPRGDNLTIDFAIADSVIQDPVVEDPAARFDLCTLLIDLGTRRDVPGLFC